MNLGNNFFIKWTFIIAETNHGIIGSDILTEFGLLLDFANNRLINPINNVSTKMIKSNINSILAVFERDQTENEYYDILHKFPQLLQDEDYEPELDHGILHYIETTGPPVRARSRRVNPEKYTALKAQISDFLQKGIIKPATSEYASAIHMAEKKVKEGEPSKFRICGDYRALNLQTKKDTYPLPNIHDFNMFFRDKTIFSRLDLKSAYHLIKMAPCDMDKTSIICPLGCYSYLRLNYGLRNAASSFQKVMDIVLRDVDNVFCYIDDIIIASANSEQHENDITNVLTALNKYGLRLNYEKCKLGVSELKFLGHYVNKDGIKPLDEKVETIKKFPKPTNKQELRRYLGAYEFYHRFIPKCAEILKPLHRLAAEAKLKTSKLSWSEHTESKWSIDPQGHHQLQSHIFDHQVRSQKECWQHNA